MSLSVGAQEMVRLRGRPPGSGGLDLSKHAALNRTFPAFMADIVGSNPAVALEASGLTEKVVVVGDQSVGKTCLVLKYFQGVFPPNYKSTIGVDFFWQKYLLQEFNMTFTLHIWDTAGQEKFRSLSRAYYRGAGACLACFDLGSIESLRNVHKWVQEVEMENRAAVTKGEFCVFLIGCKGDMFQGVSREHAEALAAQMNAEYFEVSAKKDEQSVTWLFERVAMVLFERAVLRTADALQQRRALTDAESIQVDSNSHKQSKRKRCCG
eukprot:jgi/Chlat1/3018/Chrsp201S03270